MWESDLKVFFVLADSIEGMHFSKSFLILSFSGSIEL